MEDLIKQQYSTRKDSNHKFVW